MLVQRLLDHARIDIVAAAQDHVLDPVDDEQIAVLVQIADIAGAQRAVDEDLLALARLVPVTGHDLRARAQISPTSPGGISRSGLSRSRISMTVPGKGWPAEPPLFSPMIGLQVMIGDASDRP